MSMFDDYLDYMSNILAIYMSNIFANSDAVHYIERMQSVQRTQTQDLEMKTLNIRRYPFINTSDVDAVLYCSKLCGPFWM